MKKKLESARLRRRASLLFAATASFYFTRPTIADNWTDGTGAWSLPGNWSAGVPTTTGENVAVNNADGLSRTITYDYSGPAVTLGALTLNLTGVSIGSGAILSMSGLNLTTASESVAYDGIGTVNQSGGTNSIVGLSNVNGGLFVGYNNGSTGSYALSGTALLSISFAEFVGYAGAGDFFQTGGANSSYVFYAGYSVGSTGYYSLSGSGNLSATDGESVGYQGVAYFNQSGGTNTTTLGMSVGTVFGSTGSYILTGTGSLSPGGGEYVGYQGNGSFNQSGGNNTPAKGLFIGYSSGATGSYTLSSTGSLTASGGESVGSTGVGVFVQTGGVNTVNPSGGLILGNTLGAIGNYTLSGAGLLSVNGFEEVGGGGAGNFNQTGGTHTINGGNSLYVGLLSSSTGIFNLSGTGSLTVSGNEYVGYAGTGIFNQSGGANTTNFDLFVGENGNSTGTYALSGSGLLSINGNEYVGESGVGSFNLSAGTNTAGRLVLGDASGSTGTYVLSGTGSLAAGGDEFVGSSGTGLFNQSGGTNIAGSYLYLGNNTGATGAYILSGTGSLSTRYEEWVGQNGSGNFNQSGGTNTAGDIILGDFSNSVGNYTLSGDGFISADLFEAVGNYSTGTFNQSGGVNSTRNLYIGDDALGLYVLGGNGTLTVSQTEMVGNLGTGTFTQSGGVNTIETATLIVGNSSASVGNYALSAGALNCKGFDGNAVSEYVGFSGAGNFNQTGGTNSLSLGLNLAFNAGSTGAYTLSGSGLLSAGGGEAVAYNGIGLFNQSGGVNRSAAELVLGYNTGATGTYVLSGTGSLAVGQAELVGSFGAGIFNQTGGNHTIVIELDLGTSAGSYGSFDLSGGRLETPNVFVGGESSQSGGSDGPGGTGVLAVDGPSAQLIASTAITVYNTPGSSATISAGTMSAPILNLAGGRFSNAGGTATFNQITGTGIVVIHGGKTVLAFGGGASQVNSLKILGPGTLDINNNSLAVNFGAPANDPVAAIAANLATGYNGGTWTGTSGIISSTAAAGTNPALSVGYADGNTDAGTPAGPNQILVKYTLAGDANLDGFVNFGDLVAVIQNFNKAGTDWAHGNFAYGASTNFGDLVAVVQNFNKTLTPAGSSGESLGGGSTSLTAGSAIALGATAQIQPTVVRLPEPGALGFMAAFGAGLLTCRRRK